MNWEFLFVLRRLYRGSDQWGKLYIRSATADAWEFLSYTYELPWKEDPSGKSLPKKSRIREGTFPLRVRTDGPKGWRLELLDTEHRGNIQVHRAHKSMYIQGCILPVHFEDFRDPDHVEVALRKGQLIIQRRSEKLIAQIKNRYEQLVSGKSGLATITISALLPASIETGTAIA